MVLVLMNKPLRKRWLRIAIRLANDFLRKGCHRGARFLSSNGNVPIFPPSRAQLSTPVDNSPFSFPYIHPYKLAM
jgi:hypothetical protein